MVLSPVGFVTKNDCAGEASNNLPDPDSFKWLRSAISDGPHRVGVSTPSPEDGKGSSLWNVGFSRVPDDGKSPETQ
jgi:hypothetical protein